MRPRAIRAVAARARRAPFAALLALSLLVACAPSADDAGGAAAAAIAPQQDDAITPTAPATPDSDAAAPNDDAIVLDLRRPLQDAPAPVDAETLQRVRQAVYGSDAPDDVSIAGTARGAFTAPGREQTLYMLVRGGGDAYDPGERPKPMLAVFEDGRLLTQFVPETGYRRLLGTADGNGDGVDDLLLGIDSYQMGQHAISVHALSLAGGERALLRRFDEAYLDACDNPIGERSVSATVISRSDGALQADRYRAPCPAGDGRPAPESFAPE